MSVFADFRDDNEARARAVRALGLRLGKRNRNYPSNSGTNYFGEV